MKANILTSYTFCCLLLLLLGFVASNGVYSQKLTPSNVEEMETVNVTIIVGDLEFKAVLFENPTSQSLIDQLPINVVMEDYAGMEKIFTPNKALSTENAPEGYKPSAGDITCFGPWGNVAIFYNDFRYASGLIPMGKIEDIDGFVYALNRNDNKATIELEN